uniref:Putative lysosomal cobalamin transporter n=1 Tax=Amblyomma triste TaxID=251400 RepID=A0A023GP83_AMBTT
MYRLRMGRARPQALLLLCLALVFVALALNVLVYSVCPQYATYGSQRFQSVNGTVPCVMDAPAEECVMSRGSALLVRFFFKAWVFGAAYYWATWVFLGSTVVSFFIVVIRGRQSSVEVDSDEFEDDDDEPLVRT